MRKHSLGLGARRNMKIDKEKLIQLKREGKTDAECAKVFGCSQVAVSEMRRKLEKEGRLTPAVSVKATEYVEEKRLQSAPEEISVKAVAERETKAPAPVQSSLRIVIPRRMWMEERRDDLRQAICEYACAGIRVDPEWVEEYNELVEKV